MRATLWRALLSKLNGMVWYGGYGCADVEEKGGRVMSSLCASHSVSQLVSQSVLPFLPIRSMLMHSFRSVPFRAVLFRSAVLR